MLLICSAWEPEIAKLKEHMQSNNGKAKQIRFACLGIGFLEAALSLQKILLESSQNNEPKIEKILFLGTAGIYTGQDQKLAEIYNIKSVSLLNLATRLEHSYYPENSSIGKTLLASDLPTIINQEQINKLKRAHCYSSLEITHDESLASKILKQADKEIIHLENMELFGVAKIADEFQVPWNSIIISTNYIYKDAHQEWQNHHQELSNKLCQFIHHLSLPLRKESKIQ